MTTRPRHAVLPLCLLMAALVAQGAEKESTPSAENMEGGIAVRSVGVPSVRREGIHHLLLRGQTLYSLSRAYGVSLDALAEANEITDPTRIPAGRFLFIPGATRPLDLPTPGAPLLVWPVAGKVTSPFASAKRRGHKGIDIRGRMGQEVRAAAAGRIVWAGTRPGYGRVVIIDHGGGLTTRYAHLRRILVKADDLVEKGDTIAEVGRSGNARGAHLHFEVRREGRATDPVPLLGAAGAEVTTNR